MRGFLVLTPVLLAVALTGILGQLSNHQSRSNDICAQAVQARLADPKAYSQIKAEYTRSGEAWDRDEMMLEVASELDLLTPGESNRLRSDDHVAREGLARDLKPRFNALLPTEGKRFGFALSKIDFDAPDQPGASSRHTAYCKFLVVDETDAGEPFSVIVDGARR